MPSFNLQEKLGGLADALGQMVSSAGELLVDSDLRRKGAQYIVQEASRGINEAQKGLEAGASTIQRGARAQLGAGARQLQAVMRNIERQVQDFQRQQQARDVAAELEHHHKLPVDIQIGDQVFEDMPQEMRSRLWYVLLERPDLVQQLTRAAERSASSQQRQSGQHAGRGSGGSSQPGGAAASRSTGAGVATQPSVQHASPASAAAFDAAAAGAAAAAAPDAVLGSPFAALASSPDLPAAAAAAAAGDVDDAGSSPAAYGSSAAHATPPAAPAAAAAAASTAPLAPSPWEASTASPVAPSPWQAASEQQALEQPSSSGASDAAAPATAAGDSAGAPAAATAATASSAQEGSSAPAAGAAGASDWELVPQHVPSAKAGGTGELETLDTVRTLAASLSEEGTLDVIQAAKQAVFHAMLEVPWDEETGRIAEPPLDADSEYARLLAAGCGSIEEVISRDVPRTFPEHPLFSSHEGQQRLLRVLSAYAAADPEVGYCQGQAFAAGVLLMYLPEEAAFRCFRRLMMGHDGDASSSTTASGPALREFYLPGLDHLKLELSCFELLLSSHAPLLHQHLLDAGLPALLYAAQWLMTVYSCPFPNHVAARVLDVLLQSDSAAFLQRLGLSLMTTLAPALLALDDFEALITHMKVKPLSWPLHMHRKVFAAALDPATSVSDAELAAASAAARAEFARSGRLASFSAKHLSRQVSAGSGAPRLELVPGPMGPRGQEASLEAERAAAAAAKAAAADGDGSSSSSEAPAAAAAAVEAASSSTCGSLKHRLSLEVVGEDSELLVAADPSSPGSSSAATQQPADHHLVSRGRSSSLHDGCVLVGPAGSGQLVMEELDSLTDLLSDLVLPSPAEDGAGEQGGGAGREPAAEGAQPSQAAGA